MVVFPFSYLRCSPEINRLMHQQNTIFNNISSVLRYFIPKKVPMFAMFGPGLESNTSTLVRRIMNGPNFQTLGIFPGKFDGMFCFMLFILSRKLSLFSIVVNGT